MDLETTEPFATKVPKMSAASKKPSSKPPMMKAMMKTATKKPAPKKMMTGKLPTASPTKAPAASTVSATTAPVSATSSALSPAPLTTNAPRMIRPIPPFGRFVSLTDVRPIGSETNISIDNSQRSIKQILNAEKGDSEQSDLFNAVLLALVAKQGGLAGDGTSPNVAPGPVFVGPVDAGSGIQISSASPDYQGTSSPEYTASPSPSPVVFSQETAQPIQTSTDNGKIIKYVSVTISAALAIAAGRFMVTGRDKVGVAAALASLAVALVV